MVTPLPIFFFLLMDRLHKSSSCIYILSTFFYKTTYPWGKTIIKLLPKNQPNPYPTAVYFIKKWDEVNNGPNNDGHICL